MKQSLGRLRELLDRHVVGHAEAKDALLLALVCREHIYLEQRFSDHAPLVIDYDFTL